ncbi:hypothetical protein DV736_g4522, partial [Chaetothyriales sp. CBS 134916]
MSIADTTRAVRGGRGLSMDVGLSSPYLLPPGLQHSRESLHSLSRSLQTGDDKYGRTDFIPDDGSIRTPSRLQRSQDDSSSHTSSNKQNFDTQSTKALLTADAAKSASSDRSLEVPTCKPVPPSKNSLLVPTTPGGRASVVSNMSSNGAAFRKSNDYLGAYIRGGVDSSATESSKEADTPGTSLKLEPVQTEKDTRSLPAVIVSHDEDSGPQRAERPADMARFETEQSHGGPEDPATSSAPKQAEVNVIHSQGKMQDDGWKQDSYVTNMQQSSEPLKTGASAQGLPPGDETMHEPQSSGESFPPYDFQQKDGHNDQYWQGQAPETHAEHYADEEDYYDPGEDYGDPYDYEGYNHDHWLTMGMRPLPPDDPSENPEQRANRIRSFYKEYFDESGKGPNGGFDSGYYEDQAYYDDYYYAPSDYAPGGRQRATFSNGSHMPGPRAFSSASGRYGPGAGGRPRPRGPPKRRAPAPKALNMIPTPSKLKDDTFIIDQSIDFAPPLRAVMQRSGTPDSGRGGSVPFSPTVRAHVPLASSYDDLALMPSPHMLRKSGTFTALDFAPPRFRANHDSVSDSGSIRSARSGTSLSTQHAIRAGAYRVSRIPKDVVGTHGEIGSALKPKWDMNR